MMNNPLKYYFCCRRSEIEEAVMGLARNVNKLNSGFGKHDKEIAFGAEDDNIFEMLNKLMIDIKGLYYEVENRTEGQIHTEGYIEELKREAISAKMRAEELEKQLEMIKASQTQQWDAREKVMLEERERAVEHEVDKRAKLIRSLIKFRDQLMIFRDNAEDEAASKLLANLYRETGRFMRENGIEILNQGGEFSTDHQTVAGTVETDVLNLVNTIESTFRDGYAVEGKMLRPQEVVVYVQAKSKEA